jgi:hypothetical protein
MQGIEKQPAIASQAGRPRLRARGILAVQRRAKPIVKKPIGKALLPWQEKEICAAHAKNGCMHVHTPVVFCVLRRVNQSSW